MIASSREDDNNLVSTGGINGTSLYASSSMESVEGSYCSLRGEYMGSLYRAYRSHIPQYVGLGGSCVGPQGIGPKANVEVEVGTRLL